MIMSMFEWISIDVIGILFTLFILHLIGAGYFWVQNKPYPFIEGNFIPTPVFGAFVLVVAALVMVMGGGILTVARLLSLPFWYWSLIFIEIGLSIGLVKLVNWRRANTKKVLVDEG